MSDTLSVIRGLCDGTYSDDPSHWTLTCTVPELLEALSPLSAPAAQGTVAGWKLVPLEPTEAMMDAAIATVEKPCFPQDIYAAMVAAAPSPEALPASGVEAAARVLDAAGRHHGWWPSTVPCYDDMGPIEKDEFGGLVANMLRAALTSAPAPEDRAAWRDVITERRRQIEAEGWTPEHDDKHDIGEMASAAAVYALCAAAPEADRAVMDQFGQYNSVPFHVRNRWPWGEDWLKPKSRRADLVRAGALILAEIERLDCKEGTR